jgi:sulfur carrier protein
VTVQINGEARELPAGATLDAAVREAGVPPEGRGVAVALDGEVVPRGDWSGTSLQDGQRVEVLHAVQGG